MISICVTIKDRLEDLRETLRYNMSVCPSAEFIVLDCGSTDGLLEWLAHELYGLPFVRRVGVYRLKEAKPFFDHAHAKNVAHLLATGDILINMDADNFAGPGYCEEIDALVAQHASDTDLFCIIPKGRLLLPESFGGIGGRIVVSKQAFFMVRGYDETFTGFGFQDTEFLVRLRNAGVRMIDIVSPECMRDIPTPMEKKNENFGDDIRQRYATNRDKCNTCEVHGTTAVNIGVDYGAGETGTIFLLE